LLRDLWEVGGAGLASLLLHQLLDVASAEVRHNLIKLCLHRIDVLVVIRFVFVRLRLILLTVSLVKLHHLPVFGLVLLHTCVILTLSGLELTYVLNACERAAIQICVLNQGHDGLAIVCLVNFVIL